MITIGYSVIGAVAFACFIFGIRAYMIEPNRILFLILINTSLLWFDSFATAIGQYIGEGSLLLNMTYVRYAAHWLTLPLLFIVAGMILKAADFKFAQSKYVMGFFVFLAVFFIVYDFRYMFILDFYPVCYAETFRYATQVPVGQECSPGMAGLGMKVLPIAPILLTLILFVLGIKVVDYFSGQINDYISTLLFSESAIDSWWLSFLNSIIYWTVWVVSKIVFVYIFALVEK